FCFKFLFWMAAVVTHAIATNLIKFFPKIMQKEFSATAACFGKRSRFSQHLFSNFLLGYRFILHELFKLHDIVVTIKSHAFSFATIATGATRFLVITFK